MFLFFVYIVHNVSYFNSFATMTVAFSSSSFYLCLILISGITMFVDMFFYFYSTLFSNKIVFTLMKERENPDFIDFNFNKDDSEYEFPDNIKKLFEKKELLTNKKEISLNKYKKINEKDLSKVDNINYANQKKLILSDNKQLSENKNNNILLNCNNKSHSNRLELNIPLSNNDKINISQSIHKITERIKSSSKNRDFNNSD